MLKRDRRGERSHNDRAGRRGKSRYLAEFSSREAQHCLGIKANQGFRGVKGIKLGTPR